MENAPTQAIQDDAVLLQQMQRGEERAMGLLYDRYAKVVYSVALRVLRDPTVAEEVLQETFLEVWRRPESFASFYGDQQESRHASLGGWLVLAARNRSIDLLQRRRTPEGIDPVVLASPYSLVAEAERNNLMDRARTVVLLLPPEQRKTLELAFFDGLTHTEIAEMTGETEETAKAHIHGALMTLRRVFQG